MKENSINVEEDAYLPVFKINTSSGLTTHEWFRPPSPEGEGVFFFSDIGEFLVSAYLTIFY